MASTINCASSIPSDTVYVDWELKNFKTIIHLLDNISTMRKMLRPLQREFVEFESGAKVSQYTEIVSSFILLGASYMYFNYH
jgi:hypothetical protein